MRTKKDPMDCIVQFRVSTTTRDLIYEAAKKQGVSRSDYLRDIVLDQLFDDLLSRH